MKQSSQYNTVRSIIAMLIVLLAFAIFLLFYNNSEMLLATNNFYLFISLATVGMGLMLGLLYLVNNQQSLHKAHHPKSSSKQRKK